MKLLIYLKVLPLPVTGMFGRHAETITAAKGFDLGGVRVEDRSSSYRDPIDISIKWTDGRISCIFLQ